ncbi:hypothetical protein ACOM2C_06990 [Pseudarthrobacter sp. So.54]
MGDDCVEGPDDGRADHQHFATIERKTEHPLQLAPREDQQYAEQAEADAGPAQACRPLAEEDDRQHHDQRRIG